MLLATGGAGQLFAVTTNPVESTGDGIAMALRAGVAVADVEFVQFHPTALHHPQMPRPLLSEALRGHGALLRDAKGERFVDELLPRDEVSRAMTRRMLDQGVDHLWLDATGLEPFDERFPTISAALRPAGLDPAVDWLPIAPAAHYFCGGVVTDLDGATSLPGPVGRGRGGVLGRARRQPAGVELAARGHGVRHPGGRGHRGRPHVGPSRPAPCAPCSTAGHGRAADHRRHRRPRAGSRAGRCSTTRPPTARARRCSTAATTPLGPRPLAAARDRLQRAMTTGAGVLRSAESLAATTAMLGEIERACRPSRPPIRLEPTGGPTVAELANLVEVGRALLAVGHPPRREPGRPHPHPTHPDTDPAFRCRIVLGGPTRELTSDACSNHPARPCVEAVTRALAEDLTPLGDLTSAPAAGRPAGRPPRSWPAPRACSPVGPAPTETFRQIDADGRARLVGRRRRSRSSPGTTIATVEGPLASILTAERTALNFLGHLSGIATADPPLRRRRPPAAGAGPQVWDTRKTTPGPALPREGRGAGRRRRQPPRQPVATGSCSRTTTSPSWASPGAVAAARERWPARTVHVECDRLDQVERGARRRRRRRAARQHDPRRGPACVALADDHAASTGRRRPLLEVSGGITLETIGRYAGLGIDLISVGGLTNSAPVLDIGLDIEPT